MIYRSSDGGQHPVVTSPAPFPQIVQGVLRATNEPVTVLQSCDWKGQSLSVIGVIKDRTTGLGEAFVASFDEVRFIGDALPQEHAGAGIGSQSSSRDSRETTRK